MPTNNEIWTLADHIRFKLRNIHLDYDEILQENIQRRAFDIFPNAFNYEQQRVLLRMSEEIFCACNELCNAYSVRTIETVLQMIEENQSPDDE